MKKEKIIKSSGQTGEKKEEQNVISFKTMTDKEMNDLFVELRYTSFWQAILKFNRIRDKVATDSLAVLDPFKNPTQVARAQGIRNGLYDLEIEVNNRIEERAGIEKEQ